MPPPHLATIRRHCLPLEPVLTDVQPRLKPLRDVHAVLFDVYGTLFISASGDIGMATVEQRQEAFRDALQAVGLDLQTPSEKDSGPGLGQCVEHWGVEHWGVEHWGVEHWGVEHWIAAIQEAHRHARLRGIEYPEVDIVSIWDETLQQLSRLGLFAAEPREIDPATLAVEYEMRTNPTWPMPGASVCLHQLHCRGLLLGIVSNAQFFTRDLFPALLGKTAEELGFQADLQFYSYQWGCAKPGLFLYERARETLATLGEGVHNVLYVGNDMLNDIAAASTLGFRTALFAGDARSLRLRSGDSRVAGIEPDVIVTQLSQLDRCIV